MSMDTSQPGQGGDFILPMPEDNVKLDISQAGQKGGDLILPMPEGNAIRHLLTRAEAVPWAGRARGLPENLYNSTPGDLPAL